MNGLVQWTRPALRHGLYRTRIEPVAGPIELESSKRSPSESISGLMESVLKVQATDPFEVRSGPVRTQTGL